MDTKKETIHEGCHLSQGMITRCEWSEDADSQESDERNKEKGWEQR